MRRATQTERNHYVGIYPLGYIHDLPNGRLHIEDLRGSWSPPDPTWEVRAPDGFHFPESDTHSRLCYSLKDVREFGISDIERCTAECSCGGREA